MNLETWLLFALTEAVLCSISGPAVLLVASTGLTHGFGAGIRAGLGVLAANLVYFLLSATSLGAVLVTSHALFLAVKWAGAVYLLWLGLSMMRTPAGLRRRPRDARVSGKRNKFLHGLVTQAANPKALIFFTALLPQFVDAGRPLAPQITILAATSVSIEFVILTAYAGLAGRAGKMVGRGRFETVVNRVGGGAVIAAGVGLATQG